MYLNSNTGGSKMRKVWYLGMAVVFLVVAQQLLRPTILSVSLLVANWKKNIITIVSNGWNHYSEKNDFFT